MESANAVIHINNNTILITLLLASTIGLAVALLILIAVLPTKIQYIETIEVAAPVARVYDAIRFHADG